MQSGEGGGKNNYGHFIFVFPMIWMIYSASIIWTILRH